MLGIEKAICLCLDKRQNEWEDLERQCNSKGIEFEKYIVGDGHILERSLYDRIDDDDSDISEWDYGNDKTRIRHYNAFMSHIEIFKRAKEQGLKRFLLLEDDAYFTERFDDVISKVEQIASRYEETNKRPFVFDMLFLGWWIGEHDDSWNKTVERSYSEYEGVGIGRVSEAHFTCGGLHGVIISDTMVDKLLELEAKNPIDSQLNDELHKEMITYYVMPKIVHDKGIFSNCEQNTLERQKL
tara:strand:- start:1400 stop:2122 length:723 start_codon:yes stop_codon:yes gene_type:complete